MDSFVLTNTTRKRTPRIPFEEIKNSIVGTHYAVSLVLVGATRGKQVNTQWRGKTYVPNVLSFQTDAQAGEVYLTLAVAKREAARYGHNFPEHVGYLFIHALLHLKGLDHGATMEKAEARAMKRFFPK